MQRSIREVIRIAKELHASPLIAHRERPWETSVQPSLLHKVESSLRQREGIQSIRVCQLNSDDQPELFLGLAERGIIGDSAQPQILIRTLNPCWKRFTVAKELLHLYTGMLNHASLGNADILVKLAHESRFLVPSDESELDDETFCLYLTIETMIPSTDRDIMSDMVMKGKTHLEIAKRYMIPERIIEHILTRPVPGTGPAIGGKVQFDLSYAGMSYKINREIGT